MSTVSIIFVVDAIEHTSADAVRADLLEAFRCLGEIARVLTYRILPKWTGLF